MRGNFDIGALIDLSLNFILVYEDLSPVKVHQAKIFSLPTYCYMYQMYH